MEQSVWKLPIPPPLHPRPGYRQTVENLTQNVERWSLSSHTYMQIKHIFPWPWYIQDLFIWSEPYKIQFLDLARAKSEALVNNAYKQKKLNHVMLNGDGNENGIKINRSN